MHVTHCPASYNLNTLPTPGGGHSHWLEYAYARTDRVCFWQFLCQKGMVFKSVYRFRLKLCANKGMVFLVFVPVTVSQCRPSRGIPFLGEYPPCPHPINYTHCRDGNDEHFHTEVATCTSQVHYFLSTIHTIQSVKHCIQMRCPNLSKVIRPLKDTSYA